MRKVRNLCGAALAVVAALGLFAVAEASAEVKIRVQSVIPAKADEVTMLKEFAANVSALTNGEVVIEVLPAGAVVGVKETLEAVDKGLVDQARQVLGERHERGLRLLARDVGAIDFRLGFGNDLGLRFRLVLGDLFRLFVGLGLRLLLFDGLRRRRRLLKAPQLPPRLSPRSGSQSDRREARDC